MSSSEISIKHLKTSDLPGQKDRQFLKLPPRVIAGSGLPVFKNAFLILLFLGLFCNAASAQHLAVQPQHKSDVFSDTTSYIAHLQNPFHQHADLHQIHIHPSQSHPPWLFVIFVVQLILLGYLRITFPRDTSTMFKALVNLKIAQQQYREQELSMPLSAVIYNVNLVMSTGVFLYLLNDYYRFVSHASSFISFLFFLWICIMLYSLKYSILKFVSQVFPFRSEADHYNFNFFLFQKVLGLLLIPLNLVIAYARQPLDDIAIYSALVLAALLLAGALLKGLRIAGMQIVQNKFHFLLYLCTLEIAPVCILIKVVVVWLN